MHCKFLVHHFEAHNTDWHFKNVIQDATKKQENYFTLCEVGGQQYLVREPACGLTSFNSPLNIED